MLTEQLRHLAELIRTKSRVETEIATIIGRPALIGHVGEYIAAKIFDIALERSAAHKGIDGCFIRGQLAGKTVNIKWYGKRENMLDINPDSLPDFYLVMTGPKSALASSRGGTRPWVISSVFLFNARELVEKLKSRGVKLGIATSVADSLLKEAEIYPAQRNTQFILLDEQKKLLALFDFSWGLLEKSKEQQKNGPRQL